MYETHFGFSGPPFQLNPDPEFYFGSAGHSKALSYLRYGAQQGEGFIVVTGEVGAGKTTLVRALLQELNPDEVVAAQVSNTQLDAFDLLQSILTSFGVPTAGMSKARLIATLEAFLTAVAASGRRALLVVDEAQNLGPPAIEELRMLSNFQLGHHGLLQSFLVGQPELRLQFQTGAMEQLRQRVLASYHLGPMDAAETAAYVHHRLRHVGWSDRPRFEAGSLEALHERSAGIPRRINILCNRILLAAYLAGAESVTARLVHETADELNQELQAPRPAAMPKSRVAAAPAVAPAPASAPVAPAPVSAAAPLVAQPARVPLPPAPAAAPLPAAATAAPLPAAAAQEVSKPVMSAPAAPMPAQARATANAAPVELSRLTDPGTARIGLPDGSMPRSPVLCVADAPLTWFKLRSLARHWLQEADLPAMVLVNPGSRQSLQRSWQQQVETGLSVPEVHLGVGPGPAGQTDAAVSLRFADLLAETLPAAVLLVGTSYAVLQCALIARQRGVPVIRLEAGGQRADVESGMNVLAALVDRSADLLSVDTLIEQRLLESEGFAPRQIICTGSLTGGVLGELQPLLPNFSELVGRLAVPREWLTRAAAGFGLITAQFQEGDVAPGDALQWLMLARNGSSELPLLWPVSDRTAQVMRDPTIHMQLENSGIAVVRGNAYFDSLSLLARARCVVAGPARAWVEEASAWAVPSIVIQLYADAPATPESGLITRVGPSASQFKAAVRAAYHQARGERSLPAQDNAAIETVEHLARWLPRHGAMAVLDEAAA